jgi:hypothetical protein
MGGESGEPVRLTTQGVSSALRSLTHHRMRTTSSEPPSPSPRRRSGQASLNPQTTDSRLCPCPFPPSRTASCSHQPGRDLCPDQWRGASSSSLRSSSRELMVGAFPARKAETKQGDLPALSLSLSTAISFPLASCHDKTKLLPTGTLGSSESSSSIRTTSRARIAGGTVSVIFLFKLGSRCCVSPSLVVTDRRLLLWRRCSMGFMELVCIDC